MPGGSDPPLSVVLSWPKPNYVNPQTRGPALFITTSAMTAIGTIVVCLRLYARIFITKALGVDDWMMVVSLLCAIGSSTLVIYGTEVLYIGYHVWDIPVSAASASRLNFWLNQWFGLTSLILVKISVLLFYRRLSVKFSSFFLWATWVGIGFNVAYFFICALSISLECRPTSAYWLSFDPAWVAEGHEFHCTNVEGIIGPLYSALSVLSDFYTTSLPLYLVYSLQMSSRQKRSLYILFSFGYLIVAAGIARTIYVDQAVNRTYDSSWAYTNGFLWISMELWVSVICASVPALKPFFKKYFSDTVSQPTYESRNARKSGHTFVGSATRKPVTFVSSPSDTYLNKTSNDEESWTRDGVAVELSQFDKDSTITKTVGVTVQETTFRPQLYSEKEQYEHQHQHGRYHSQSTRDNTTDRHSDNSEEPILDSPHIPDHRRGVPPVARRPTAQPPHGREASFVTISSFPMPEPRIPSRVSEHEELERDVEMALPLQGARAISLPPAARDPRASGWTDRSPSAVGWELRGSREQGS